MAKRPQTTIGSGHRVSVAAFGKHPGWNDHIDEMGIDNERLVEVKRLLYTNGISAVIDSGYWESLSDEDAAPGFDHTFISRWHDGMVVGRMWSSSDGRGRKKYPMIVCAHCRGVPSGFVFGRVLPRLQQLEAECRAADRAAVVISLVDQARSELRSAAETMPGAPTEALPAPGPLAVLAKAESLGPGGEGLRRVLYELGRNMGAYVKPEGRGTKSRSRTIDVNAQHIRLPRLSADDVADATLWLRGLLGRLDALSPVMVLASGRGWIDGIVGDAGPTRLQCLQASSSAIAIASEVAYSLDGEFVSDVDASVAADGRGEPPEYDLMHVNAGRESIGSSLSRAASSIRGDGEPRNRAVLLAGAAGGAVLIVALIVIVVLSRSGGTPAAVEKDASQREDAGRGAASRGSGSTREAAGSGSSRGGTDETVSGTGVPAAPVVVAEGVTEADRRFAAWCVAADAWLLVFARMAPESPVIAGDAYLSDALLGPLAAAQGSGVVLDPRDLIATAPRSRALLAERVLAGTRPVELSEPATVSATDAASALIETIEDAVSAPRWAAASAAERAAAVCERVGSAETAAMLRAMAAMPSRVSGEERISAIERLAEAGPGIERLAKSAERFEGAAASLGGAEDRIVRDFGTLEREVRAAMDAASVDGSIASSADRVERLAVLGEELSAFLADGWLGVDAGYFEAESLVYRNYAGSPTAEVYERWLAEARDPRFARLDAGLDPRGDGAGLAARIAASERLLGAVNAGERAALAKKISALRAQAEELEARRAAMMDVGWTRANRARIERERSEVGSAIASYAEVVSTLVNEETRSGEELIERLRAKTTVSEAGIDAIDAAWMRGRGALIATYETEPDYEALQRGSAALEAALVGGVEQRMVAAVPGVGELGGVDVAGLRGAFVDARDAAVERVVRNLAADATFDIAGLTQLDRAAAQAADGLSADADALESIATRLSGYWDALRAGERPAIDAMRDGMLLMESWRQSSGVIDRDAVIAALGPSVSAISRWQSVGSMDRAALLETARSAGAEPLGTAVAAWTRLVDEETGWPGDARQLESASQIAGRIRAASEVVSADGVASMLDRDLPLLWTRAAMAATDRGALAEVARRVDRFGVDEAALPARVRFDLRLLDLAARVSAAEAAGGEAGVHALLRSEAAAMGDLAGELPSADAARVTGWMGDLMALAQEAPDATPPLEAGAVGPGRVGWDAQMIGNGERLVYRWGGRELAFRRVEIDGEAKYLCETEAPAWLLTDYAKTTVEAELIAASLPDRGSPLGPMVWAWNGAAGSRWPGVAAAWRPGSAENADYYAKPGAGAVGVPTADHPINMVSPVAASLIARSAGCRVMSEAEWRAAAGGGIAASDRWNLRDRSFGAQRDDAPGVVIREFPDAGSFPAIDEAGTGANAGDYGTADGVLWFRAVAGGSFADLVGNVAEWALTYGPETQFLRGDVDPLLGLPGSKLEAIKAFRDGSTGTVIGGSALSPPEASLDVAYPDMGRHWKDAGYADVGFRLAFDAAGGASLGVRAARLAASAPWLVGGGG